MPIAFVGAALCACSTHQPLVPPPRPPLVANYLSPYGRDDGENAAPPTAGGALHEAVKDGELTLPEAIGVALRSHPALIAARYEVRARGAEARQAGLRPNPELQTDVEGFGGSGPYGEGTVTVGQLLELGGKRQKRRAQAVAETQLAQWDLAAERLSVYADVAKRYVLAVASDQRLRNTERLLAVARRLQKAVDERVDAGKVSPIEGERAMVVVGRAQIERDAAAARQRAALRTLTTTLGGEAELRYHLTGKLGPVLAVPARDQLVAYVASHPSVARWDTELRSRQAALKLAEAGRLPDITVGAGVKRIKETHDTAYVTTFTVPLPLFDRNQGAIAAARDRLERARAEAADARMKTTVAFDRAYADLSGAASRSLELQNRLLPAARKAFEATEKGYREGKFDLLALLDAQRVYFESLTDMIDAAAAYYTARVDVETLIGRDLDDAKPSGTGQP